MNRLTDFKLEPHQFSLSDNEWKNQELDEFLCIDEWEAINISGLEISKIPVANVEGNAFTHLQSISLTDTDDKAVPLKLTGKDQFLILAFFSFESLKKDEE